MPRQADTPEETMMRLARRTALAMGAAAFAMPARAAGPIRLGLLRTASPAPLYIAQERGWFRDAGVEVQFRFFDAAQPIAAAAVAGDTDMGITALTGGFFALAGKGELVVIGGGLHEQKGVRLTAVLVSKKAYDAGLTSLAKLGGHSLGITQYGSSFHYMAGRLAEIEGFDLKSVTLRPLQTVQNMVAAVRTGQVDATMAIASMAVPAAASGEAVIIGWVGDKVPYQITALFASRAMVEKRADDLAKFAAAYKRGVAAYREAFLNFGADGQPVYGPATDAAIADIMKYVFVGDPQGPAKIKAGLGWYDVDGALNVADVRNQLAWFSAQGMVKGEVDANAVIDTRFLPTR
jgi:NitT/TauT family transport system substrate-binding protein